MLNYPLNAVKQLKKLNLLLVITALNLIAGSAFAQYPTDYFASPLDIPIYLAGNFGEIRSNHFHAGLDMKTEGVEGKNILASADGYVSRIKIGHGGYGKTLYVNHPNGYTTVYAHLQKFNPTIEAFVKSQQYLKESYEIELFPSKEKFIVKKGETIATSGNSGGSGGPHLHFEIRDTETETPINPLLFGFDIKDDIKPTVHKLGIYPIQGGKINNSVDTKLLKTIGNNGKYTLETTKALIATGKIGFGIEVQDKLNGSNNRCGVYSISLLVDSTEVYCHNVEKIAFHESRYINSHVCFYDWKKNKSRVQRSYVQPNNKLGVYKCGNKDYSFEFNDNNIHRIQYIVKDTYGNTSSLSFDIQSVKTDSISYNQKLFKWNETNRFDTSEFSFVMPSKILYDDIDFEYKQTPAIKGALSPTYHAHHIYEPLHKKATLTIKADSTIKNKEKTLIVALDNDLKVLAPEGGEWTENNISIKTRSLGPYTLMMDTVPPSIRPFNVVKGRNMTSRGKIQFSISDELSGIQSYRGTIDGKWILMEYDYKLNRLTHYFSDNKIELGKTHTAKIEVIDKMNNTSNYSIDFVW